MKTKQMKIGEIRVVGTSAYVARHKGFMEEHRCEGCIFRRDIYGFCKRNTRASNILGQCGYGYQTKKQLYFSKPTVEEMIDWVLKNYVGYFEFHATHIFFKDTVENDLFTITIKKTYRAVELLFVKLYTIKEQKEKAK